MSVPLKTTTFTVKGRRPVTDIDPDAEGYDDQDQPPILTLATAVGGSLSHTQGQRPTAERNNSKESNFRYVRMDFFSYFEGATEYRGLARFDTVIDNSTGIEYQVTWVAESEVGNDLFGLDHIRCEVKLVKGYAGGLNRDES